MRAGGVRSVVPALTGSAVIGDFTLARQLPWEGHGVNAVMNTEESKLEMLRRHVREGAAHITQQRTLISRLQRAKISTADAYALLATFEELQRQHESHLAKVESATHSAAPADSHKPHGLP